MRYLASEAGRAAYNAFVVFLHFRLVSTWVIVVSFTPCLGDNLYKVVIAFLVLGKKYEMVAAVVFGLLVLQPSRSYIYFTSYDWLEFLFFAPFGIQLVHVIEELFDAHHVAVVGEGNAFHAIGNGLVNKLLYGSLPVKYGVL